METITSVNASVAPVETTMPTKAFTEVTFESVLVPTEWKTKASVRRPSKAEMKRQANAKRSEAVLKHKSMLTDAHEENAFRDELSTCLSVRDLDSLHLMGEKELGGVRTIKVQMRHWVDNFPRSLLIRLITDALDAGGVSERVGVSNVFFPDGKKMLGITFRTA